MEVKTKQRLVGILVLLAILAIFLPVLFYTSRPSVVKPLSVAIPPRPTAPTIVLSKPNAPTRATTSVVPVEPTVETNAPGVAESAAPPPVESTASVKKKQLAKVSLQNPVKSNKQLTKVKAPLKLKTLFHPPKAWVVQLGAFAKKENADHLITELRDKGFDAYVRPMTEAHGKRLYRVYVGPEIRLDSAQKLRTKLQASYHLNGVVRKYKI